MDILIPAADANALSEDDLAHHVRSELDKAYGSNESETQSARYKGMRYYYGELPRRPALPRSGIRSTDIPDVCDALISEIMPMFSNRSTLIEFDPLSPEDNQQAIEESKAVNYLFFERCDGAAFIRDMLQDGLLQRNATAQVEVMEDLRTETRRVGPVTPEQLSAYMQNHVATKPNESMEIVSGTDHENGTSTVVLRRTWSEHKLSVTAHPPENVFVCNDHDSLILDGARFVSFLVTPTRSELVELGVPYDTAYNKLPRWTAARDYDATARDRANVSRNVSASHKSGEQVECYRCFYWIDVDGDGVAELHEILYSPTSFILSDEIIDHSNLASFSPWPVAHTWVGTGLVDKLEAIVKGKTVFLRQTIDNMVRVNNQRLVCVSGRVDPSAVDGSDPLAPIWVTSPDDVRALTFPNAGAVGYQMLEYLDKIRRERVGGTLEVQSSGSQSQLVPGDTAHGAERIMTMLEKQAAQIANNLGEMLKQVFRSMHQLLRESDFGPFSYAVGEQMRIARPDQWPERMHVSAKLGYSEGQRLQKLAALEATYQKQMQMLQLQVTQPAAEMFVTSDQIHTTLIEILQVAGLDIPQRFWLNPSSPQARQMQGQKMQQQAAMAQVQQAQQSRALQLQEDLARMTIQNEELKIRLQASLNARKQRLDEVEAYDKSSQAWTELEIEANKNLNEKGQFL